MSGSSASAGSRPVVSGSATWTTFPLNGAGSREVVRVSGSSGATPTCVAGAYRGDAEGDVLDLVVGEWRLAARLVHRAQRAENLVRLEPAPAHRSRDGDEFGVAPAGGNDALDRRGPGRCVPAPARAASRARRPRARGRGSMRSARRASRASTAARRRSRLRRERRDRRRARRSSCGPDKPGRGTRGAVHPTR